MIKIRGLTLKNFLSVGNVTQSVNFEGPELVLVLGENLDLGGQDNRNGVGKTTIVNALSYALYGKPLVNVKMDNLINKSNLKHMLVTLEFTVDGTDYKIERGRKPGIFKFIKNGQVDTAEDTDEEENNEAQGENRHTQEEIERLIGVSHDMFKHIIALNTYVEPFLALSTGNQRVIIEQLLGITKLSEKAEKLKDELKETKENIKDEELVISTKNESNKRIEQNITTLEIKSTAWEKSKIDKINGYQESLADLLSLDVDQEISAHKTKAEIADLTAEIRSLTREMKSANSDLATLQASLASIDTMLATADERICPTCNQAMDQHTHQHVKESYDAKKAELESKIAEAAARALSTKTLLDSVQGAVPATPATFYSTLSEVYEHKTTMDTLGNALAAELESQNPYTDQISMLKNTGLQEIDFTKINELTRLRDHQEFLLKLLTSKDSFIRKKIIDQNILFLNVRLAHYLGEIGLPHLVKFKSDLDVEITLYGKEFDFDNLSRGERTRLILSLSWAFRDVYESLYGKINLLFIDELVDQGLDSAGAENVLKILKSMGRNSGKNIFLISHKEEYVTRIDNVLKVIKENNFTSFEVDAAKA